ncbi:hypothetical protein KKH23_07230 [Patescibacteria group bacterium]|uniref:Uncharacterized protein n=1 Tax=viral metagenome TaxID=1070528 RepID=A0A6M3X7P3_9ZZZZ|nr:hypothetical protein [Patescibacteria group bacterium]
MKRYVFQATDAECNLIQVDHSPVSIIPEAVWFLLETGPRKAFSIKEEDDTHYGIVIGNNPKEAVLSVMKTLELHNTIYQEVPQNVHDN